MRFSFLPSAIKVLLPSYWLLPGRVANRQQFLEKEEEEEEEEEQSYYHEQQHQDDQQDHDGTGGGDTDMVVDPRLGPWKPASEDVLRTRRIVRAKRPDRRLLPWTRATADVLMTRRIVKAKRPTFGDSRLGDEQDTTLGGFPLGEDDNTSLGDVSLVDEEEAHGTNTLLGDVSPLVDVVVQKQQKNPPLLGSIWVQVGDRLLRRSARLQALTL